MKTRFSHRLKQWEMRPDQVLGAAVVTDNAWPFPRETRVIWLWLPSWGFGYDYTWGDFRWGQRVLLYNGRTGFSLTWRFE